MAKVLGKAGEFASDKASRLRAHALITGFVVIGLLGLVEGMTLSSLWSNLNAPGWLTATVQWGIIGVVMAITVWGWRKMNALEIERKQWQRGTDGESVVGKLIAKFPDGFHVINDINTGAGNLDHVVVGPTGVFVLDAKNWRGLVQADGTGELLLNGKRLDKDYIKRFVGRIMGVKERICPDEKSGPYFRGLFVFTAARVEARWGQTGQVHCLREDQLWDYIVECKRGKTLNPAEVEKIAQGFQKLGLEDPNFTDKATHVIGATETEHTSENNRMALNRRVAGEPCAEL